MSKNEHPEYIRMCDEHNRPLEEDGFCLACAFHPDMQSTYLVPTASARNEKKNHAVLPLEGD